MFNIKDIGKDTTQQDKIDKQMEDLKKQNDDLMTEITAQATKQVDEITKQNSETPNNEISKSEALNICYKRAKECSDDTLGIEYELKGACLEIYTWTSGTSEILDFAEGLC